MVENNILTYRKSISFVALIAMIFTLFCGVNFSSVSYGGVKTATLRNISILAIDGDEATVNKGGKKEIKAAQGMKIGKGYTVTTGKDTTLYFQVDDDKAIKLSNSTSVLISEASKKKLSITLKSGEMFFNVKKPVDDGTMVEFNAGGTSMGIRGTQGFLQLRGEDVKVGLIEGESLVITGEEKVILKAMEEIVLANSKGESILPMKLEKLKLDLNNASTFIRECALENNEQLQAIPPEELEEFKKKLEEDKKAESEQQKLDDKKAAELKGETEKVTAAPGENLSGGGNNGGTGDGGNVTPKPDVAYSLEKGFSGQKQVFAGEAKIGLPKGVTYAVDPPSMGIRMNSRLLADVNFTPKLYGVVNVTVATDGFILTVSGAGIHEISVIVPAELNNGIEKSEPFKFYIMDKQPDIKADFKTGIAYEGTMGLSFTVTDSNTPEGYERAVYIGKSGSEDLGDAEKLEKNVDKFDISYARLWKLELITEVEGGYKYNDNTVYLVYKPTPSGIDSSITTGGLIAEKIKIGNVVIPKPTHVVSVIGEMVSINPSDETMIGDEARIVFDLPPGYSFDVAEDGTEKTYETICETTKSDGGKISAIRINGKCTVTISVKNENTKPTTYTLNIVGK